MPDLTHKRLLELLHYDPATGWFTWRAPPHPRLHVGDRAGSVMNWLTKRKRTAPWRSIKLGDKSYQESRLAWLYMTGTWPEHEVDHRDKDRLNNSWNNLRAATKVQSCANRGCRSDSMIGIKGVVRRGSRFRAYMTYKYRRQYLGTFDTAEEAAERYRQVASAIHGEFAHHD